MGLPAAALLVMRSVEPLPPLGVGKARQIRPMRRSSVAPLDSEPAPLAPEDMAGGACAPIRVWAALLRRDGRRRAQRACEGSPRDDVTGGAGSPVRMGPHLGDRDRRPRLMVLVFELAADHDEARERERDVATQQLS